VAVTLALNICVSLRVFWEIKNLRGGYTAEKARRQGSLDEEAFASAFVSFIGMIGIITVLTVVLFSLYWKVYRFVINRKMSR
jgi:hypothetical protein